MEKKLAKIVLAILVLCAFSFNTSAQIITIGLEATVNSVNDIDHLLEGKVAVGSTITGTYTYDTSTPDSQPLPTIGDYWYSSYPCDISLNVSGFSFKTDPTNVNFIVEILNDDGINPVDGYLLLSRNNLPLSNGVLVDHIAWQLDDSTSTSLSSDVLPLTAPDLSKWDRNILSIGSWEGNGFWINATVTSAALIPEPATLLFLAIGLPIFRILRRK